MARTLLCIVPANLDELRVKGVEKHILQRDLGGYWDHVITVHPFANKSRTEVISERHTVVEYKWRGVLGVPLLIGRLVRDARKWKPTAIKVHDPYACGLLGWLVSKVCSIPYAVMICSSYDLTHETCGTSVLGNPTMDKTVCRFVLSHADAVFGGSGDATEFTLRNGAQPDRTCTVRTGGVEECHFESLENRRDIRQEMGWGDDKVILFVGRLSAIKFPEDAIKAFAVISQKIPKSRLIMAGDGGMLGELQNMVDKLRLKVEFPRFVPQDVLVNMLFSADVILAPLSGSSLVESALSETPIVAYDVDWHRELIVDGVTGVLVKFRDFRVMGRVAVELLQHPELCKSMGQRARQAAIAQHSLSKIYEIESQCFDTMLNRRIDAYSTSKS